MPEVRIACHVAHGHGLLRREQEHREELQREETELTRKDSSLELHGEAFEGSVEVPLDCPHAESRASGWLRDDPNALHRLLSQATVKATFKKESEVNAQQRLVPGKNLDTSESAP